MAPPYPARFVQISLLDLGKKYARSWVFRNLRVTLEGGGFLAITGKNGSGKSTLISMIANLIAPTEGEVQYRLKGRALVGSDLYPYVSICSPHVGLVEELTVREQLDFHYHFRKPSRQIRCQLERAGLTAFAGRQIRHLSSGLRQRVKLTMAFFSDTPLLLLDEPTSYLDKQGFSFYEQQVEHARGSRTLVVASNLPGEAHLAKERLRL